MTKITIRGTKVHETMLNQDSSSDDVIMNINSEVMSKKNQKRTRNYRYHDYIKADNYLLFRCAVQYNDVDFMKKHECFMAKTPRFLNHLLLIACRFGNGEMIEYLMTKYSLKPFTECYRVLCRSDKKGDIEFNKEILTELLNTL